MRGKRRGRGPDQPLVLVFNEIEVSVLGQLLDELDDLADRAGDPPASDPANERLYPPAHADANTAAEFRDLTQTSLQHDRRDRYGQCRAELPGEGGEIVVEAESVQRWLMVLNDMRLVLGTRLGVTADGFADEADGANAPAQLAYHWLTAVQDDIVTSVLE
jgi:hypothetical protein